MVYSLDVLMERVGIGYDIHRLIEGRKLILGGVEIPYAKGLDGHSDGDVLLHAICDGLLGAVAAGDIGEHFPDSDYTYKDISSFKLLEKVRDSIYGLGYAIANIDTIIICQEPLLTPFKGKMQAQVADILQMGKDKVNIKATTAEGLGFLGRNEAIAAHAIVLLNKASQK